MRRLLSRGVADCVRAALPRGAEAGLLPTRGFSSVINVVSVVAPLMLSLRCCGRSSA
jgi:hypothetical protein